ncbi:MAG: sulfatase [Candidatus Woesearchaeota archaeon]
MKFKREIFMSILILTIGISLTLPFIIRKMVLNNSTTPCENCNVILITFDTLRADHLGVYGYTRNTSPNIDKLAKRSYVFTNALSQAGETRLSVPSFITSKLPLSDNILDLKYNNYVYISSLHQNETTIAEILSENNYNTYAVMGYSVMLNPKTGVAQGFKDFEYDCSNNPHTYNICPPDWVTLKAIKILEQNITNKPFFLWVYYFQPHAPYNPPLRIFQKFSSNQEYSDKDQNLPVNYDKKIGMLLEENASKKKNSPIYFLSGAGEFKYLHLNESDIQWFINAYDGNINYADEQFGRLLMYLEESGLLNNTIIIINSDHGEMLGDNYNIGHGGLKYSVLHVPIIVYVPGRKGGKIAEPVTNADIMPTILSLLEIKTDLKMIGKNLFEIKEKRVQIAEAPNSFTVVYKNWKILSYYSSFNEIEENCSKNDRVFDILKDPQEKNGKWQNDEQKEIICNTLKKEYFKIITNRNEQVEVTDDTSINLDTATIEKLKSLGYAN